MRHVALAVLALAACSDTPKYSVEKLEDPATCGDCHSQHFQEWGGSMHAYASQDPVFVAMNKRGQRETNGALGTFCLQCHAPMAVALGDVDPASFDPSQLPAQEQGVTCYFCHDVKAVEADHNNGLVLALDDTMRGGVHDPTDSPAHNSKYDPLMDGATNQSTACGSCHDVVTPTNNVALERTYQEWHTTIFATNPPPNGLTCSQCHMGTNVDPPTDQIGAKAGLTFKHRTGSFHEHMWIGIDQAYTPFAGTDAAAAQAMDIARDLNPAVTIVGPTPRGKQIGEGGICVTHEGNITVRMDTRGTGHMWPSGAAQDRRAWLELIAYDADNNILFQSGNVGPNQDPEDLGDANLVGFWDRTVKADGMPAHFFWEVVNPEQSVLLKPPITLDVNSQAFDHSTTATFDIGPTLATQIDHITARLRIRPITYAVLNDLVSSGDLDPSIAASIPTLDITGATRTWTAATVDPVSDGCDYSPYQ
jgi:hypothetical protein